MNTLRMLPHLDQLFHKTHILTEQPRLDPWLAKVLVTELLWGKKCLKSHSKPVLAVLAYEKKLQEELKNLNYIETSISYKQKGNFIISLPIITTYLNFFRDLIFEESSLRSRDLFLHGPDYSQLQNIVQ